MLLVLVKHIGCRVAFLLPAHISAHVELLTHRRLLELTQLVWIHLLKLALMVAGPKELLIVLHVLHMGRV